MQYSTTEYTSNKYTQTPALNNNNKLVYTGKIIKIQYFTLEK